MFSSMLRDMMACLHSKSSMGGSGTRNAQFVAAGLLCVFMPFEDNHLLFMLLGAVCYLLLKSAPSASPRKTDAYSPRPRQAFPPRYDRAIKTGKRPSTGPQPEHCPPQTPVVTPLAAPTFHGTGWEAEVAELLEQITPTPICAAAVAKLTRRVEQAVQPVYPGANVAGYVNGSLASGKAFGVAVPDVDIVVSLHPAQLIRKNDWGSQKDKADTSQPLKAAIRACIDRLVNTVGLKFRRSAFRGREPKVTFLAPSSLGIYGENVPLDFSINSLTPWRNAALLEELGQSEPRVKALVLLVKRWAKDRGICHAAKGHLPPYAWTLLSIYYLQAGVDKILEPIEDSALSRLCRAGQAVPSPYKPETVATTGVSVAELFKGFLRFYAGEFDWCHEAVSVRFGCRAAEKPSLLSHVHLRDDGGATRVGPCVEDPFDQACNLADSMTLKSLNRLHEEFVRAESLCASDASLAVLLEPWAPAEPEKVEPAGN